MKSNHCEDQIQENGVYRGVLWGTIYSADFDLSDKLEQDLEFRKSIADLFAQIECFDLLVSKLEFTGGFIIAKSDEGTTARRCQCGAIYRNEVSEGCSEYQEGHPDNGCDYGVVEDVLNS